uniref:Oxysterol binding protein-like 3a n=1 Tax=Hippocampus comes TaxID=109280 RepID=A0A3Q2ZHP3_HIPCM
MSDKQNLKHLLPMKCFCQTSAMCCFSRSPLQDNWEIVEGLRGAPAVMQQPEPQRGFLLKRRKWPMKGWHKRFFVLDKGILKYAKHGTDLRKGKIHGCIDVGLSVMAIKKSTMCIDLDTEDNIYHLKTKSPEVFEEWVSKLRHHRVFRQNEISSYPHPHHYHTHTLSSPAVTDSIRKVSCVSRASLPKQMSIHQAKVSSWLHSSEDMNKCAKDLEECESHLLELNLLLRSMEVMHRTYSASSINALQVSMPRPLFANSQEVFPESPDSPVDVSRLQENFNRLANIHSTLKSAYGSLSAERDRLRQSIEMQAPQPLQVTALKTAYGSVSDTAPPERVRSCDRTITTACNNSLCRLLSPDQDCPEEGHSLVHQASNESKASIAESISEFYDAQEYLLSSSSSENELSDDDSYISDVSDSISVDTCSNGGGSERHDSVSSVGSVIRRRTTLPAPSPPCSVSLWNILRNNIGKDLSKVAMPVQLNEPLNTLQRLCEELEYSELLDTANKTANPYQRMVYVATFAITAYTSSYYRAGSKPFNPVLGETYECDRPDKGFRFIGEQVSHHPPVSVCHSDSKNFSFWQDVRLKNKFWGKSMEIVPIGTTNVMLPSFGDHYEWNKVTSCIHNILSGQRWIEHYGEMTIKNVNSNTCECKITFVKAKSWSSSVNEIEGVVTDSNGQVVHSIFGKWHESIFQGHPPSATCIWRANPMPVDQDQYYGFTQFAMELNELDPTIRPLLPPTDTRFRLDQRLLEEGNVEGAEEQKQRIEQLQRERRKVLEDNNMTHRPCFFKKSEDDTWVSNNSYWELRRDPGFTKVDFPVLW